MRCGSSKRNATLTRSDFASPDFTALQLSPSIAHVATWNDPGVPSRGTEISIAFVYPAEFVATWTPAGSMFDVCFAELPDASTHFFECVMMPPGAGFASDVVPAKITSAPVASSLIIPAVRTRKYQLSASAAMRTSSMSVFTRTVLLSRTSPYAASEQMLRGQPSIPNCSPAACDSASTR